MKHPARKISRRIQNGRPQIFRQLVQAVHDVQRHRDIRQYEDPAAQDAWDRLRVAVMEAERILQKKVDKRHR